MNKKDEALRLYFEEGQTPEEIAQALGFSLRLVRELLADEKRLKTYCRRSEAAKLRAQICVNESAEAAARRQAALLHGGSDATQQRAAKDILDRAGIGAARDGRQDVSVVFPDVNLGMPEHGAEEADGG